MFLWKQDCYFKYYVKQWQRSYCLVSRHTHGYFAHISQYKINVHMSFCSRRKYREIWNSLYCVSRQSQNNYIIAFIVLCLYLKTLKPKSFSILSLIEHRKFHIHLSFTKQFPLCLINTKKHQKVLFTKLFHPVKS